MRRAGTTAAAGDAEGEGPRAKSGYGARDLGGGAAAAAACGLVGSDWVQEALYESQRGFYLAGRFKFSGNALLPFDPPQWTTPLGTPPPARPKHLLVPSEDVWEWATEWLVDMRLSCDRNGWQYAFAFFSRWHPTCGGIHRFVRRRKWVRFRRIKPQAMLQRSAEREDMDAARDTERVITVASAAASATPSELSGPTPGSCGLPASAETLTEPSSAVGPAKGAIGDEPQAALPPPPHKAGLEAADDAESSPDAMWRRLMNECRIDRERLEVLCCLLEAVPEEVVSRLDDCLAVLDYNRSRATFLRTLLETSKDVRRRVSREGTPERREVERRLAFFSYWAELGIGA